MNEKQTMPVVPLRGMTILPGMLIHFDISRNRTIAAIEEAMKEDQITFLVTQLNGEIEEPKEEDLYSVGTIAEIKQLIKLPGDIVRVMVQGMKRARLENVISHEPFVIADITAYDGSDNPQYSPIEVKAMISGMRDILEQYFIENNKISKSVMSSLLSINEVEELIDQIAINIPLGYEDKQKILEAIDITERYNTVAVILTDEISLLRIKKDFQAKVKAKVDKNQKDYILREQLKLIGEELGENNTISDAENYLNQLKELEASQMVKEKIEKEINHLKSIGSASSESAVVRGYIETLLELPWERESEDHDNLKNAAKILNEDHYGLEKVKERILEFLAVRSLTKGGDSPIICLVGPPGTGKTSIARSVARALDKEYVRISLGGVRDEAEIRGHRKTYVGAMPGRIINGLKNAGVKNPLMLLDEVDKVGSDHRGDTSSALLEVLDSEQNKKFVDHYVEIPVDLSQVLFIATANSLQTMAKPLLDRMEIIEVSSYTLNEKVHIAKDHLIPKQMKKNGIAKKQLSISTKALELIISGYTREAGVRNLERKIGEICRKTAIKVLEDQNTKIKINEKNLPVYLGKIKYSFEEANKEDEVGIVKGLAWTSVGGDTLQIEVNVMPGKGRIELTGQLGDVMKESARAGISYIRSVGEKYHIKNDYFDKHDVHIHIPEGAVPKDGPSAGITMATAVMSAITDKKIRADIAMTGEITLRGKVLPIGGLKEKLLAAKTAKLKLVLVPKKNEKDIEEISGEILEGLEIRFVETMEEVLNFALVE
ncbi:ATP-dependent Lon protease [Mobilisporobacter senegalensis]|uniref:Lon protease n=1 Tax=Mobilisporobacter senegalensis TaxID=1329262 RepID=A0A3N1XPV6_9FIRM|nr:endopeptidase La [Mobilisporobacter senegalensis]ROR28709.1 ATP-dependent Lon protease [Mobilisporobacter senegalensis]